MAIFRHISTKMVLALDAGSINGKKVTKRVTISNIREDASTDALWELAQAMGKLLEYPVAEVRLYKVEAVEREEGDGAAGEKGDVHKDADEAQVCGGEALPAAASRCGVRTGNGSFMRGGVKKEVSYIPAWFDTGAPRCARDDCGGNLYWHTSPLPREALLAGFPDCREMFFHVSGYTSRDSPRWHGNGAKRFIFHLPAITSRAMPLSSCFAIVTSVAKQHNVLKMLFKQLGQSVKRTFYDNCA